MSKKRIVEGLYYDDERQRYTIRPTVNGRRTERTLKARTEREAIREFGKMDKAAPVVTVKALVQTYLDAGTPGSKMCPGKGEFAAGERSRCASLVEYFGTMRAADAEIGHCLMYKEWRVKRLTKKVPGGRTVDLDLGTLSNVFRYACLRGDVKGNPFVNRPRFAGKPEHCREHCARSGDELHTIARALAQNGRESEVVALQFLFECCSGCRTGEALPLRRDAEPGQPGYIRIEAGQRYLCIARLKQGDEDPFDYILVNEALELVLSALERWHAGSQRQSGWFFPGRPGGDDEPLSEGALAHALRRVGPHHLPKGRKLTSHGARAFYVTWRRAQRVDLMQIAAEVGHRSGIKLLLETYGRNLPAWAAADFSPFPRKIAPAWGPADSTKNSTSPIAIPDTAQSTPVRTNLNLDSCIVLFPSPLDHTMTR